MIRFFVKNPISTLMFISLFVVLGLVSFFNLNTEQDPKIEFPMVTVEVIYPGATPYEVETLIINKIEDQISEISAIKKINSNAYEGLGHIIIEFLLGCDVNSKSIEVKDQVESILNELPDGAEKPIIKKFDPLLQPIINLVLTSNEHDERDLFEYADKKFKDRLSKINGVASVDIFGGRERQINVDLDADLMKQFYISIDDIVDKVRAKNRNIPSGNIDRRKRSFSVRFQGEFLRVEDIANMVISSQDGSQFLLKDIAKITDGYKKVETMARYNMVNAVNLSVKKVSDGNAVNIAKEIHRLMPEFREMIPSGMDLQIAADSTKFIVSETKDAKMSILVGILLTALILYLFTGHLNLTFISSIVIPTSVMSSFFLMDKAGFTINMMTLLAIATSLGTLIANAIVIIEHVLERLEMGDTAEEAAINGTTRCAFALLASTGTNLVVFTPIAFMAGIVGQFMKSFGLTVVFATIFSLIASFSLTPMLCAVLLKNLDVHKEKKKSRFNPFHFLVTITDNVVEFLKREYLIMFERMMRFPKTTLLIVFFMFYCLRFIMPFIGGEFYPSSDQDQIYVDIKMPQGATIERTNETVTFIEEKLKEIPEVKSFLVSIGENGVENASVIANLVPLKERKVSDLDIIDQLIPVTSKIPDAEIEYSQAGGMEEADITINVVGVDYEKLVELSSDMKSIMEESGYFRSVALSHRYPKTEVQFIPDNKKMIEYDVDNKLIGRILRTSIYGDDSNVFKEFGEEYKINIELDKRYKNNIMDIYDINVISRKGMIPITELGSLKITKAIPNIKHRDKNRIIQIEGELSKSTADYVQKTLDEEFKKLDFIKGYGYKYSGTAEFQEESNLEMGKAFLIAVILTFMLLAGILNSLIYPIAIVSTVVTSFIGVFLFLFFSDKSINVASMLGMIMLVGLVVNDAILLVEYSIYRMKQGAGIEEAIRDAVVSKFRPILLTSLAIISGTVPQFWSIVPLKNAMAAVIIGGMFAATFFTFTCVPVLFWYLERFRRFFLSKSRMLDN